MGRIEDIEARWAAAIAGPWKCTDDRGDDVMVYAERDGGGPTIFVANVGPSADGSVAAEAADQHTGKAIAAAPEDVAWLVARVRELEAYGRRLGIPEEKWVKIGAWKKAHDAEKHIQPGETVRYAGAIGGAYTYTFTPTSLGTVVRCECACKEYLDVTDYDDW